MRTRSEKGKLILNIENGTTSKARLIESKISNSSGQKIVYAPGSAIGRILKSRSTKIAGIVKSIQTRSNHGAENDTTNADSTPWSEQHWYWGFCLRWGPRMKRKNPTLPAWTPFKKVHPMELMRLNQIAAEFGVTPEDEVWLNSRYQVNVRHCYCDRDFVAHLSIKRIDKSAIHDWRELQRIKNEIVGPENEALEIYPAESRLVDTSNQYHLWVFVNEDYRIGLGFRSRMVTNKGLPGGRQRPFPLDNMPPDIVDPLVKLEEARKS